MSTGQSRGEGGIIGGTVVITLSIFACTAYVSSSVSFHHSERSRTSHVPRALEIHRTSLALGLHTAPRIITNASVLVQPFQLSLLYILDSLIRVLHYLGVLLRLTLLVHRAVPACCQQATSHPREVEVDCTVYSFH